MKPPSDTATVSFRVSHAEHLRYSERARERDLTLSDWLRFMARRDCGLWMGEVETTEAGPEGPACSRA